MPDTQVLDGRALAAHLGVLRRRPLVDFPVDAHPWSWRKDRYSPRQIAALWRRQLARPEVSREFPAALYLHVPFCTHTCGFCRCFRLQLHGGRALLERYAGFLCDQIDFFAPVFSGVRLPYFSVGGGTPSILPPPLLRRILTRLRQRFDLRQDHPMSTFEMSFPTMHNATLDLLAEFRVPRISVGVQTLRPEVRRRDRMFAIAARRLEERVRSAMSRGLRCNLDLVLGLPGETPEQFLGGFRSLLAMRPSSVIVNILNLNYFQSDPARPAARSPEAARADLRRAGEGMAAAAARAGYRAYPHGNTFEAFAFFSPEFDREFRPHREIFKRLAGGVLSVQAGTSVLALGSLCNQALLPDYLVACFDQDYRFDPDRVSYQCCRKEVYSLLYPREEDLGPSFGAGELARLAPLLARLRRARGLEVMPSAQDVLIEFPDPPQADGRGRVFIRPFALGRPCAVRAGPFALAYNGERTAATAAVLGLARRLLAAAADAGSARPR